MPQRVSVSRSKPTKAASKIGCAAAETDIAENLFYVFVRLNSVGVPEYYIVPRNVVAKYVRDEHRAWLATPGRGGKAHKDNPMRNLRDRVNKYRDRWKLLGLD